MRTELMTSTADVLESKQMKFLTLQQAYQSANIQIMIPTVVEDVLERFGFAEQVPGFFFLGGFVNLTVT